MIIIDTKPDNLSTGTYLTILNNYGFFLSETEDRYQEAVPILERVIELSPERVVAYLNIGDVYFKLYQEKSDDKLKEKVKEYYSQYISLLKVNASIPLRVKKFLRDEAFEKAMEEIRKTEYKITYYSSSKNFKDGFFKNFLEDFKKGENIKFVEPILETDDIDNKKLNKYFKDNLELKERIITAEIENRTSWWSSYRICLEYIKHYESITQANPTSTTAGHSRTIEEIYRK